MSTETLTAEKVENEDGYRTYIHPLTGEEYVSVTTVISDTQSKPWLAKHQANIAVTWVLANLHQLGKLGPEKFAAEAKSASERIRDLKRDVGVYEHDVIEALLLWAASPAGSGADIQLPDLPDHLHGQYVDDIPIEDFANIGLNGFLNFVSDHDPEFIASEMAAYHRGLKVAGTVDIVARLPKLGMTACIDTKTGKHLKDVHEQLAMYRRMEECLLPMGQMVPMPATDAGMVLHLRPNYARGYRLMLVSAGDDAAGFNRFRRALTLTQERAVVRSKPGKVLYPPLPDGSQPPPQLCDLDGEIHGRVTGPLIKAGLESLADVAKFTVAEVIAIKGVGPKSIEVLTSLLAEHGLSFAAAPDHPLKFVLDAVREGAVEGPDCNSSLAVA